jgi:outer membrane protein assembly factor BamD
MFRLRNILLFAIVVSLLTGCSFRRRKYENPITNDSEQPDKILFDKAVNDIEKGRYQIARLTLNTLMNTYDTSEYMAKAKLAVADSWMREGTSTALAQAEAEYKDFELFYPNMEESAEAQEKICEIHFKQMEKPDRDPMQAQRAEDECRNLLLQYPNSKFAPRAAQRLRNIQEALAEGEFRVGSFYFNKGSFPSAANRLENDVNAYPLFSKSGEALWMAGESYAKLGPRWRPKAVSAYQRLVRDYPLSPRVEEAKAKLQAMEAEVPEADPEQVARMKYEAENYDKPGRVATALGMLKRGPDMSAAAKQGEPALQPLRPSIPVSIPTPEEIARAQANQQNGVTADVGAEVITGPSALDTQPDARQGQPKQPATPGAKPGN